VSSSAGRSSRNFWSHRHTYLWPPQEDGVPCVYTALFLHFRSEITTHSTRGAQGDPPTLPVRPTHSAHITGRAARHPKHKHQSLPPTKDANHDVLLTRTQAPRTLGTRRRIIPSRAVARSRTCRQSHRDALHVLAILRRPTSRAFLCCHKPCSADGSTYQCLGQDFALNEAGYFIVRLLQRFRSFSFAPEFMPAGSLPPKHWVGMPGRQGVEKIHPAINFTLHSKVRLGSLLLLCWAEWTV
jgi:hypothetical protein